MSAAEKLAETVAEARLQKQLELDVAYRGLTTADLPAELWNCTLLNRLNLSHNRLREIPADFKNLTELRHINLCFNELSTLPYQADRMVNVQSLACCGNRFAEVPRMVGAMGDARVIDFSLNQLTAFPDINFVGEFLTALYLSDNQLTLVPKEVLQFHSLEILVLRDNKITHINRHIGQLTKLHTLLLQGNRLTYLPAEIVNTRLGLTTSRLLLSGNPLVPDIVDLLRKHGVTLFIKWIRDHPEEYQALLERNKVTPFPTEKEPERAVPAEDSGGQENADSTPSASAANQGGKKSPSKLARLFGKK